jgi:hypothetical protein
MKAYIQLQNLHNNQKLTSKVFNCANLPVEIIDNDGIAEFEHNGDVWYFLPSEYVILGKEHDTKKPLSRF